MSGVLGLIPSLRIGQGKYVERWSHFFNGRQIWPFNYLCYVCNGHALGCHYVFNSLPQLVGKNAP